MDSILLGVCSRGKKLSVWAEFCVWMAVLWRNWEDLKLKHTVIPRLTSDPANDFSANEYFFYCSDSTNECSSGCAR